MAVTKYPLIIFTIAYLTRTAFTFPSSLQEDPAVTKLRTYLRFRSAHPDPDSGYEQAIPWLEQYAEELGLEFNFLDLDEPNRFAVWMTWRGSDPSLKSVLLNSHMDVVAAEPDKWEYHPFEAYKDAEGNIFGRGASDMKSATIAELEAIRKLKTSGFQPLRTIHLTVMPDEELGGVRGMIPFVKTDEFKNLNVGINIDEGFPIDSENMVHITYAEKSIWQFNITARGAAGHASTLPEYTAGQRLQVVIDKLLAYRESELQKLQNPDVTVDQLTSLNLVRLGGGIGDNTIPNEVWASFDMRIWLLPNWNFTDVENMILNITEEARLGSTPNEVTLNFILKSMEAGRTTPDDSNVWWTVVQDSCREMNITCPPNVLSAATDGRYVRSMDIPVFGICPFPNTPNTAHQDNEFINEANFLKGIERYATLIQKLAVLPGNLYP
ncbi:Aminoacylase-1A [Orchesella cincta]|uniref:N-acyl-aliphatic-L-amino acid amidohydrolase n=1 Tax=Orchesella cincta TaxID=48709 RepID=A0A1D2N535_ORCCI|nr:Aminoacylase-1A [Orchesella cincta]